MKRPETHQTMNNITLTRFLLTNRLHPSKNRFFSFLPALVLTFLVFSAPPGHAISKSLPVKPSLSLFAEENPILHRNIITGRPALYLDCSSCDYNHIRREIGLVHYVRDPGLADIHLFITRETTADGGTEFELSFIGRRHFSQIQYAFTHLTDRSKTTDEIRSSLTRAILLGLTPYLMKTTMADLLSVKYEESDDVLAFPDEARDPWNHWVFEAYAGRMQLDLQSRRKDFAGRWGFFADRVTEDWKIRLRPYFNYYFTEIERDNRAPAVSRRHRHGFDSYVIKSLSSHWSVGVAGDYITRQDHNLKHHFLLSGGLEYSLFPYVESTRRSITFKYGAGYHWFDYYDPTIFGRTAQQTTSHLLETRIQYQQPWGSIHSGITGTQFFHDPSLRRLQSYTRFSIRLTEGLNLSLQANLSIIRDQLSLRAGDLDLEDILLAQREMATNYSFMGLVAISYTFGSAFANVVNTRFF